jgi:hypothetical protein
MIVLAYLGRHCTTFHVAGWTCLFSTSFYLELCIWLDAISRWRVNVCDELRQIANDDATFSSKVITGDES